MAAGDIRAGGAFVEIFVKGNVGKELDKVAAKLKGFGDTLTNIGKKMALLGVAITAPLLVAAERFAKTGAEIDDVSQRTGVAVGTLQELKYAAELAGASFEDLEAGIRKMQKSIFDAAAGSAQATDALASIGLEVENLTGLSPDEQFVTIAEAMSKVENEAAKSAVAMELFGKGGAKLIPLFADGAEGIKKAADEAKRLGLIFDTDAVKAAAEFDDVLDQLKKQLGAVVFQIGGAVANAVKPFLEGLKRCIATVIEFVKNNRALVTAVVVGGAALVTAGTALIAFGLAVKAAGLALGGLQAAFGVFKLIGPLIGFLLNPIVLVGAGLAALAGYFIFASDTGAVVLDYLKDKFAKLGEIASKTFGGIADALTAGDISLAAQILWKGLQSAWSEGTSGLKKAWADWKASFVQVAVGAFYGVLEIWQTVKAALMTAWEATVTFMANLWDTFTSNFSKAWEAATDLAAKGILKLQNMMGQLSDSDTADAIGKVDSEAVRRNKVADETLSANVTKRNADRDANISAIQAERDAKIKAYKDANDALSAGATAAADDERKRIDAEKAALQQQLDALREKAKAEKTAADNGPEKPRLGAKARADDLDNILALRGDDHIKNQGLFNAAGILGVQVGPFKKMEEYLAEIAKNTKAKGTPKFGAKP